MTDLANPIAAAVEPREILLSASGAGLDPSSVEVRVRGVRTAPSPGADALLPARFRLETGRQLGSVPLSEMWEPDRLAFWLSREAEALGRTQHKVIASMLVQQVATYLGGASLSALVVEGRLLTPTPDQIFVSWTPRDRWTYSVGVAAEGEASEAGLVGFHGGDAPNGGGAVSAVAPSAGRVIPAGGNAHGWSDRVRDLDEAQLEAWVDHWVDGIFPDLIERLHEVGPVSRGTLRDNVAAAVVETLVLLDWWSPGCLKGSLIRSVLRMGRQPIGSSVEIRAMEFGGRVGLAVTRKSCCLMLKSRSRRWCSTCPKLPEHLRDEEMRAILSVLCPDPSAWSAA